MDVMTGVVVDGKVVVEGEQLPEGKAVGVFLVEDETPYELSPQEADEINKSIDDIDNGRCVDGDELLQELTKGA